jgi:hypothetical protein
VQCEDLFLVSRGTALPPSLYADGAIGSPQQMSPVAAAAAAFNAKQVSGLSTPPAAPALSCSQANYGSKVGLRPLRFLFTPRSATSSSPTSLL